MIWSRVVTDAIVPEEVLARVGSDEDGAALLFLGVVRDHADGRAVTGMRYDAYAEMAAEVLAEIAREAAERLGTDRVAVVHRTGELAIGDVSVAIAVSSPHRAESFDASRYVIEEIKKRLPVWKKERYADGADDWVAGTVPPGPGERPVQRPPTPIGHADGAVRDATVRSRPAARRTAVAATASDSDTPGGPQLPEDEANAESAGYRAAAASRTEDGA